MPQTVIETNLTGKQFLWRYLLPALLLLTAALWFGAQKNFIFALTGFLACFLTAVTLVVEGRKRIKRK